MAKGSPMTLTAYAKRRGVSPMAVSKAVKAGRLRASVGRDGAGRPTIADPAVADREWAANSDESKAPSKAVSFQEARTRKEAAQAEISEVKLRRLRGELVEVQSVESHLADVFTRCRTKLLGIPSRVKQQLPHLNAADVATIDRLVREALEDLASEANA